jgi:hypothetical protein
MFLDVLAGFLYSGSLVSRVPQSPCDVRGDAQHVIVVAVGRAFINELLVRLPATVRLLLRCQPLLGALNHALVHVMYLRHVVELHQAVRGQNLVRRRFAKPGKPSALHFERQQLLISVRDVALGLCVYFGCQLLDALHVVEREHVRISARRSLLKAPAGHAQNGVHAFHDLAHRSRVKANKDLARTIDGRCGKFEHVTNCRFKLAVEDNVLLASVRNHFNFAHHNVRAFVGSGHLCRERQLEFADALGLQGELRTANVLRINRN